MMSVQAQLTRSKIMTELVAETFSRPDARWLPFAIMFGNRATLVRIPLSAFADEESKDQLADELVTLTRSERADTVVMIQEAWVVEREDPDDLSPARLDPERVEALTVAVLQADEQVGSTARIKRAEDQIPQLDPWEDSEGEMDGRFVSPLVSALQAVRDGD